MDDSESFLSGEAIAGRNDIGDPVPPSARDCNAGHNEKVKLYGKSCAITQQSRDTLSMIIP